MTLDDFDLPLTTLEQHFAAWVAEVLELRFGSELQLPVSGSTPSSVQDSLVQVRQRLDRVEGILSQVLRARGRCKRAAKVARSVADDRWDASVVTVRKVEYQGPRERYAEASLASFEQLRDARAAEHLADVADEAYDVVRLAQAGLSALRYDHVAVLRGFAFESSLER